MTDLPSDMPPPPPFQPPVAPKKHHRLRWTLLALGAVIVLFVVIGVASGGSNPKTVAAAKTTPVAKAPTFHQPKTPATTIPPAPAPTTPPVLTYTVTAGAGADITYDDIADTTVQEATAGDWTQSYTVTSVGVVGIVTDLSVQNGVSTIEANADAVVSCSITWKGRVVDSHTASGYNIAECSYQIPGSL